MKFRKKPVVIEAVRARDLIVNAQSDWSALPEWIRVAYEKGGFVFTSKDISIPTLEGSMIASPDDWVIQGIKGEIYPCKPDIFEATYDRVD